MESAVLRAKLDLLVVEIANIQLKKNSKCDTCGGKDSGGTVHTTGNGRGAAS